MSKKLLIQGAAARAAILLKTGCERVVILWDENPPWTPEKDIGDKPCWHTEREQLIASLQEAEISLNSVGLVYIEREFETWLLHDHQLLEKVIPTNSRTIKIKRLKDPLGIDCPKVALMALCRKHKFHYNAGAVGIKFRNHLNSLERLKLCDTFRYFVQKTLGAMPRGWRPYAYRAKGAGKRAGQN